MNIEYEVKQEILVASDNYTELDEYFGDSNIKKLLIVCDSAFDKFRIKEYFETVCERLGIRAICFSQYTSNPKYEEVVVGVEIFNNNECDGIVAVGGGSTIDVAKCIKLFCHMDHSKNYLEQRIEGNDIPFLAIPTTAGTGSEATRYAVIYYEGNKQSIMHISCIPRTVLMDFTLLSRLPDYQRKVTMLDALCHAIESMWSVNSTDDSKNYARKAIQSILANKDKYLSNDDEGNANMLNAAYLAGKAINITQTTAGHAMSYKLTSLYGIAHGHAVALCVRKLWPYMVSNMDRCSEPRGREYLLGVFEEIAHLLECDSTDEAVIYFDYLITELQLEIPEPCSDDFNILINNVNPDRLKNNPVKLDSENIDNLYHQILG